MILLLGGSGYIGRAFKEYFEFFNLSYWAPTRNDFDYTDFRNLYSVLDSDKYNLCINAAGFTGKPNVDQCEKPEIHSQVLVANVEFPLTVAQACELTETKFIQISSGCIYAHPDGGAGLDNFEYIEEAEVPNFCYGSKIKGSFYSGSKALMEKALRGYKYTYICRPRIPFNEVPSPRNYLTKLMSYNTILDAKNSMSDLNEFVRACYALYEKRAPYGIYNVVQSGGILTREVTQIINKFIPDKEFNFFPSLEEFNKTIQAPRSNCILSVRKINQFYKMSDIYVIMEKRVKQMCKYLKCK